MNLLKFVALTMNKKKSPRLAARDFLCHFMNNLCARTDVAVIDSSIVGEILSLLCKADDVS